MNDADEYLTATEAQREFGISHSMMTNLLRTGKLAYEVHVLDQRIKWIKSADVAQLLASSQKRQRALARTAIDNERHAAQEVTAPETDAT